MANKVKSLNSNAMHTATQKFFKTALVPQIILSSEQSMARANFLFPFHRYDYVDSCRKQRDYYFQSEAGDRTYRYPLKIRQQIDCSILQGLPSVKIQKNNKKANCAEPTQIDFSAPQKQQAYVDLPTLSQAVADTIANLNKYRAQLDALVKLRKLDKLKPDNSGYSPHVEKKPWLLPSMRLLNATDLDDAPVIKAIESYNCHLVEAAKTGLLPVILANTTQQDTGSLHLNHMGRFFGFGQVEYKQLQLPTQQVIGQALNEIRRELVLNWLELQAARIDTKKIAEREIYATALNHELAVAQLLMQNPAHAQVFTTLLRKFQHDPVTPKWLRTFKNFALAADLAFIPIALLGGFVTGGVGIVPILLMANAVNFLWVGATASEYIVARNRYRFVERALLTGNTAQIKRGMKVLRALHEKRRDLITSGAIGAPLTLTNLTLIARGLDNLSTVPIDAIAAFSSDIETLSMSSEASSDAQIHNEE